MVEKMVGINSSSELTDLKGQILNNQHTLRTLREDQPPRLLLNLFFYHFNRSKPTHKSQCIKLLDVIATCNQLNVNALN